MGGGRLGEVEGGETDRLGLRGYWMGAAKGMGTLLRERLGERYRAVALTGYHVATQWPGRPAVLNDGPDPRSHSFDRRLHELDAPYLIVDPAATEPRRTLFGRPRKEWLGRPKQAQVIVREQFAAVLYLDRSPAMTPL
ncbi:erythromycin esterase family protein [Pseudonocardia acaciae]|uniref:erythromycin esterase family protein n=1 Tax=Pseudonocardia acaciae TaxID=551276 RepID=UPI00048F4E5E|nr:erythromycin esterase family protein [Pseudonocardia acaciae]